MLVLDLLVTEGAEKVMVRVDVDILQLSLLVEANVSITVPEAISAAEGRYWALSAFGAGEKVPVPLLDQRPVVVPPVTEPANCTEVALLQTIWFDPATAKGGGSITTLVVTTGLAHPLIVINKL